MVMKNQNIIIACVITAFIAGGVGFVAHGKIQDRYQGTGRMGDNNARQFMMDNRDDDEQGRGKFNKGDGQGMMGRGPAQTGEVTAKDAKTLTLKMSDGSTKLVILSDTTSYRASTESSLDKVEVGTKIAAFGTQSTDGSTVATSIEINPMSLRK